MDTIAQLPSSCPSTTVALCTKNFPEFAGTQQTIKAFLQPHRNSTPDQAALTSPQRRTAPAQRSITAFFTSSTSPKPKQNTSRSTQNTQKATQSSVFRSPPLDLSFEALEAVGAKRKADATQWQQFLSGRPPPTPSCHCGQPTVQRSVTKPGENRGRKFFVCSKPVVWHDIYRYQISVDVELFMIAWHDRARRATQMRDAISSCGPTSVR